MKDKKWTKLFRAHEIAVLEAFTEAMDPGHAEFFLRQMQSVGVVQRAGNGSDVNMYAKRLFGAKQLDCSPFPDMPGEFHVATCRPAVSTHDRLVAKLWFVDGRPFSIEFEGETKIPEILEWRCELISGVG
jgi:hypothetical protein